MTRFNIFLQEAIEMVLWTDQNSLGGEIVVPKLKSFRIKDLAEIVAPNAKKVFTGVRPGEKIHETLVTKNEGLECIQNNKYYLIINDEEVRQKYLIKSKFKKFDKNFDYSSDNKKLILSKNDLRKELVSFIK